MSIHEIDPKKATFDDIEKFAMNLLQVAHGSAGASNPDAEVAYWRTMTQVVVARKMFESAGKLASEIDSARISVARSLEQMDRGLDELQTAVTRASDTADKQARRIVWATWGLVVATFVLGIATAALVCYTRELVHAEATPQTQAETFIDIPIS